MYANNSDAYWKRQQKRGKKSTLLLVACVLVLACAIGAVLHHNSTSRGVLTQRRALSETTEQHWKLCETRVDSRQECIAVCQPERNSMQRKVMLDSCLSGCQQSHVISTSLACRGKVTSEEDVFDEIGGLAYIHCSKYQSVDPKPDAFATCRKYHRAGTKSGFRLGSEAMTKILDEEWGDVQKGLEAEDAGMWKE